MTDTEAQILLGGLLVLQAVMLWMRHCARRKARSKL